ncbi:alpha/beta hydrolase [Acinetobacter sp. MB5]|uniref:alpha/beta hydrolase n=1 Tax=Acinetobacter sp. MB5 TaxID=2069438 RepID=UPI001D0DBBD2|nr:alpha/beta hydrolase [Acinetobacter sp. MB5]
MQRLISQGKQKLADFRFYDLASQTLNRCTPRKSFKLKHHLAYGLKARQRLDLYCAQQPRQSRPLLVFVHGGSWAHGNKDDYVFLAESFTREGFDVAILNYHLAPQHIFPSYIDDLVLALNYLHQQQVDLKISTENLVLMGHSAGSFNVMSAIYHPQSYDLACRDGIRAVVGIAGPYHFDYKGDQYAEPAFDIGVPYQQVMPYYFVESNSIRHFLLLAEADNLVGDYNTYDMHRRLNEVGNHSEVFVIPRTGHITIIATVSSWFSRYFQTKAVILKQLNQLFPPR